MGKTTINPYLAFNGNCREAMTFYQNSVDGNLEIMPFESSPVDVPEDYQDKIMHASLQFGDAIIMASDGMPGQEVKHGDANAISIGTTNLEEAEKYYQNLSEGGNVLMPFQEQFWGAKFGMFFDKYGIKWMINCKLEK